MKLGTLLLSSSAIAMVAAATAGFSDGGTKAPATMGKVPSKAAVNYAEHVAPILNKRCAECHRPGEVAPFSLIGYENAKKWAAMVASVTESRRMPPWKATEGFGEFADVNRLTPEEIQTLKVWSEAGARRGDPKKEPPAPKFESDWPLGKPDLVLEPAKEYKLDAEGNDVYRNFVIDTNFKEPTYVTAMAVKPGNPKVVHHVIAFLDNGGNARKLEAKNTDGQPGYSTFGGVGFLPSGSLGGWAPGLRPRMTPAGSAFRVEPGASVVLQVHYHKTGKPETDKTRVGLYLSKEPVKKEMQLAWWLKLMIHIPAGAENHKETYVRTMPRDVTLYGVMPHMHLLGRKMKAWVEMPDGSTKPLINVDDWDFNWQLNYMFKEPLKIPKGSKVHIEAVYDNSTKNPNNPSSPPKDVFFGEQTTDEMFLLVAAYTVD